MHSALQMMKLLSQAEKDIERGDVTPQQAIFSHLRKRLGDPKRSAGWFETFHQSFWLPGDGSSADEAVFLRRALQLRRGQQVLDCPCGAGRIALELAKSGMHVTGVDLSPAFIRRARTQLARLGLAGEFLVMDMRRLNFENRFHALINWHGSFGYFSDAENTDVLARMSRALRTGGRLVIDVPNREAVLRHFRKIQHGDIEIHSRWDRRRQRIYSIWRAIRDGKRIDSRLSIRLYTPSQYRQMFQRAGLEIETIYGDRSGGPFGRASKRCIVIGRKI